MLSWFSSELMWFLTDWSLKCQVMVKTKPIKPTTTFSSVLFCSANKLINWPDGKFKYLGGDLNRNRINTIFLCHYHSEGNLYIFAYFQVSVSVDPQGILNPAAAVTYSFSHLCCCFHSSVGPHVASLRFLHSVPVSSWETAAPFPESQHTPMPDSPFVTFSPLPLSLCLLGSMLVFLYLFPLHSISCTDFTLLETAISLLSTSLTVRGHTYHHSDKISAWCHISLETLLSANDNRTQCVYLLMFHF